MEINKIYCESNLVTMSRMPNEFVDLTVTSPPYDGLREYNGYSFPFEQIAKELFRVTKKGGVVVWVVSDQTINGSESGTSFRQALFFMGCGFKLHDTMIYKKNTMPLNHNRYEQDFEYMFIFSKGKPKTFNPILINSKWFGIDGDREGQKFEMHRVKGKRKRSGKNRTNVKPKKIKGNIWEYNVGSGHSTPDEIAFKHPAIFPEQLANDHIISWSNEGDLVFDPFCGSGTTPKIAHIQKRKWIASEISPEYVKISETRISKYINQLTIF